MAGPLDQCSGPRTVGPMASGRGSRQRKLAGGGNFPGPGTGAFDSWEPARPLGLDR
jgi:hypothetical protein